MIREVAVFCAWAVAWSLCTPCGMSQSSKPSPPTLDLKERVVLMPAGSVVEVRLINKEKLRGRLGAVTDSGFDIQYVENNQTLNRTVSFQDVKSVKAKGLGMSTVAKIGIGVAVGVGLFFVVLLWISANV